MNYTNSIGAVVKILETPKKKVIRNNILVTTFRVQLPQTPKNYVVFLKIWGNLVNDVLKYYSMNDYILVEGYLAIKSNENKNSKFRSKKKIEITVLKVYPFFLK